MEKAITEGPFKTAAACLTRWLEERLGVANACVIDFGKRADPGILYLKGDAFFEKFSRRVLDLLSGFEPANKEEAKSLFLSRVEGIREEFGVSRFKGLNVRPLFFKEKAAGLFFCDLPAGTKLKGPEKDFFQLSLDMIEKAFLLEKEAIFLRAENKSLLKRNKDFKTGLNLLFDLAQKMAISLDYSEFVESLGSCMGMISGINIWGILLGVRKKERIILFSRCRDKSLYSRTVDEVLKSYSSLAGKAVLKKDVDVEIVEKEDAEAVPAKGRPKAVLNMPIILNKKIVGLLHASSYLLESFSEDDIRLFQTISQEVSSFISRTAIMEKREELLLKTMIEGLLDAVVLFDPSADVVIANSRGYEFLRRVCTCRGKRYNPDCIIHSLIREFKEQELRDLDREFSFEGRDYALRASAVNLPGFLEKGAGTALIVTDVTERKGVQAQVFQASKLAAIGELAAGVAHEINNPLTSVLGFTELLLMETEDRRVKETLEAIKKEADRAKNIVLNLLGLSRTAMDDGKGLVDINSVIKKTLSVMRRKMENDGIDLVEEYEKELLFVYGNEINLQQVFLNILQNAQQAVRDFRDDGKISVKSFKTKTVVGFMIKDNGPGIDANIMDRIFNPFFTTKPPGKGTGLGLSISHKIVKEHGGTLRVESEKGKGALFIVELPATGVEVMPEKIVEKKPVPAAGGLKILAVDDEVFVLSVIKKMLKNAGHSVDCVGSGKEALSMLDKSVYDVILLDLRMPEMDGRKVFESITERDPELAEHVIFISGDLMGQDSIEFLHRSKRPYIIKPFSLKELLSGLNEVVQAQKRETRKE